MAARLLVGIVPNPYWKRKGRWTNGKQNEEHCAACPRDRRGTGIDWEENAADGNSLLLHLCPQNAHWRLCYQDWLPILTKAMCITTWFSVPWILQSIRSISPTGKEYEKDISILFRYVIRGAEQDYLWFIPQYPPVLIWFLLRSPIQKWKLLFGRSAS